MNKLLNIRPLAVRFREPMHRERVSEVMHPRLEATAITATNTGMFAQPPEGVVQRASVNRLTMFAKCSLRSASNG